MEDGEKPSFENFLSKPSTLTDHLMWQLGSLHVNEDVYRAAELVIGNLNEEGYLTATDDELLGLSQEEGPGNQPPAANSPPTLEMPDIPASVQTGDGIETAVLEGGVAVAEEAEPSAEPTVEASAAPMSRPTLVPKRTAPARVPFSRDALREAIDLVKQMDLSASARATCASACWRNCTT